MSSEIEREIGEFLEIRSGIVEGESYRWTHGDTLLFLTFYKQYRKQVGSLRIKSLKKMYEEIAKEMRHKLRKNITSTNCENKWRVLERAYKKYIADSNQTGGGRQDFEYAEIMTEILEKKRNVHPELLLAADTVDTMPSMSEAEDPELILTQTEEVPKKAIINKTKTITAPYRTRILKSHLLKDIRNDRQTYYKRRLEQDDRKLEEKVRKNKLLEEKNVILKNIADNRDPAFVNILDA